MRIRLICLGAVACAVALAQPAAAQVQPAGTGEPLFTNSARNTQFLEWPDQGSGIDAYGGGPNGLCDAAQGFVYGCTRSCSVPAGSGKATSFNRTADYGSGSSPAPGDGPERWSWDDDTAGPPPAGLPRSPGRSSSR